MQPQLQHEDHATLVPAPSLPLGLRVRSWFGRAVIWLYFPAIFRGMAKTFEWMLRPKTTLQYPEERHVPRKGYRGEHRLKKDVEGRPKCVACFMCQTACPAECITIVAGQAPWPDRDKVPVVFEIDMLKCIYCGMCEEACPCDAIELTQTYTQVATTRAEKIYDMERLLEELMSISDLVFFAAGGTGIVSAVLMVTRRNPVYSAVWLLGTFLSVAVLFVNLSAAFLAAIHVLVYTGAILVLFLFVIMLLNLKDSELGDEYPLSLRLLVAAGCAAMFVAIAAILYGDPSLHQPLAVPAPDYGSIEQVGMMLFVTYGLQFELVSVLIIVAMFGAVVLAKKKVWA